MQRLAACQPWPAPGSSPRGQSGPGWEHSVLTFHLLAGTFLHWGVNEVGVGWIDHLRSLPAFIAENSAPIFGLVISGDCDLPLLLEQPRPQVLGTQSRKSGLKHHSTFEAVLTT